MKSGVIKQRLLPLRWPDSGVELSDFHVGLNETAFRALSQMLQRQGDLHALCLYGTRGSGITHLLTAACHAVQQEGFAVGYLPLSNPKLDPVLLEGMEHLAWMCWDDLDAVIGDPRWEEALFHSYNRILKQRGYLLIGLHQSPMTLSFSLPDFASRLRSCIRYPVVGLTDSDKLEVLKKRAAAKGFEVTDEVGHYWLSHAARDMSSLMSTLESLDHFLLETHRRLTIPLLKKYIVER